MLKTHIMTRMVCVSVLVLAFGFPSNSSAMFLQITGQYTGLVNGSPIDGTATGHIDTTGNSLNHLEIEFNSIPSSIHPFIAGNSWNSSYHGSGVFPAEGAVNLFDISGGNYIASRTVRWPDLGDEQLVFIADVSTDLVTGIINATQQVSGTYSGPTDLVGVEDYQMLWTQIDPTTIEITSEARIERANGEFLNASIVSVYTGLLSEMPTALQAGTYRFSNQSFSNNIMSFDWDGTVAVPETALSGSLTTYFHQHDGDANSISIDLGGGPVPTGRISFESDPSDPNSYLIFDFDTMTVIEESNVLVSAPGLGLVGTNRLPVHISESGTITDIDPNSFVPGVPTYFEMTTDLTGEIIIPPGSPFEGFIWTNKKVKKFRAIPIITEDGRFDGIEIPILEFEFSVSGEITPPGQDPIPLDMTGTGFVRSDPAPDLCDYLLLIGDVDGNCRVDLSDLALMVENWLIDCNLTPLEPACAPG